MTTTSAAATHPDPSVFLEASIAPETTAFNEQLRAMSAGQPGLADVPPSAIRGSRADLLEHLDHAEERTVPGPGGDVGIRVLTPPTVNGVHLYLHGGGWAIGSADAQDPRLWELAQATNQAVVSVEYRLAPEDPYPAPNDDCEAVASWLAQRATEEFGTATLTIGGGSAGAHLAVTTMLRMRDRHAFSGFSAANLVFGVYDLGMTPSQVRGVDAQIVPTNVMAKFYEYYLPAGTDLHDPDVSPLYADLAGLPPALFSVGTNDSLLDDSLFMHQRWLEAGNRSELAVYPGGIHGFTQQPDGIGAESRARQDAFLAEAVAEA
jgi:acetyl esterase/lipase